MKRKVTIASMRELIAHAIDYEKNAIAQLQGDNPQVTTMRKEHEAKLDTLEEVQTALHGGTCLLNTQYYKV